MRLEMSLKLITYGFQESHFWWNTRIGNGLFSKPKVFRNKNTLNCYGFFLQII